MTRFSSEGLCPVRSRPICDLLLAGVEVATDRLTTGLVYSKSFCSVIDFIFREFSKISENEGVSDNRGLECHESTVGRNWLILGFLVLTCNQNVTIFC
jgi:hypothetical protein